MKKSANITLCLLTAILLIGCRSAKPEAISETVADSVTVSADSSINLRHVSASVSEKAKIRTEDKVEFIDGGGDIYISADGSLLLSGVAGVRSSRSVISECSQTKDSFTKQLQTKDSITVSRQSSSHTETRPAVSSGKCGWKLKMALALLFVLMILIVIAKFNNLSFNQRGTT